MRLLARAAIAALSLAFAASPAAARDAIPAEHQGDWVPASGGCDSAVRLRVAEEQLTLRNGSDSQTWGNVAIPQTFFGPDYTGNSVVALPDWDGEQPFTVFFNADEKPGVTRVDIYHEMKGPQNAQLQAIQAKAKKLAERFPLNGVPLKKCAAKPS
ncbi:MAG: hypothetical protein DCC71_06975 [Proteobacteria bacterium]|nr:MAG: hypothetical protein DCC71_06975 [Pseudomonadota bacterium]